MSQSGNMQSQETQLPGPPYPPTTAALGGQPTIDLDVPLASVFMVLYIIGASMHMYIFQRNRRRQHKFIMSGMLFGFSMSRILTMVLRICWAIYTTDVSLAIAASIFVQAGVLLLFVINLLFAQRVVRAAHPKLGWHPAFSWFFRILYILIPAALVMVITTVVMSFYTLDVRTKLTEHDIQLGCQTYLLFVAVLPLPLASLAVAIPRGERGLEKFGSGRWRTKIVILLVSSALLALGAGFRVGVNFTPPRPIDDPAWYQSKACFWVFNFVIEIIVIYSYAFVRVDTRFHVPNKARQAGGYAAAYAAQHAEKDGSAASIDDDHSIGDKFEDRILSEEEVFDGEKPSQSSAKDEEAAPAA